MYFFWFILRAKHKQEEEEEYLNKFLHVPFKDQGMSYDIF